MNVSVHFIDQHVSASIPLPDDVSGMMVHDLVNFGIANVKNDRVRDIFVAIKEGNVKWFRYLRSIRPGGTQYAMDDKTKPLASIILKKDTPSGKGKEIISLSAPYSFPCTRCGACCMPGNANRNFSKYLGDVPPRDNKYFIKVNGMPCQAMSPRVIAASRRARSFRPACARYS